jgi:hypothetical protein
MTEAVSDVAATIRESKSLDVHPNMYSDVMEKVASTMRLSWLL